VRIVVASIILLASVSITSAQKNEEDTLVDRLLSPRMSLINSAQDKKFSVANTNIPGRALPTQSWIPNKSFEKSFPTKALFRTNQFAVFHLRVGERAANISPKSGLIRANTIHPPSAPYASRTARENGRALTLNPFPADRPFSDKDKTWKDLGGREAPLTIEQVRELLNKNK